MEVLIILALLFIAIGIGYIAIRQHQMSLTLTNLRQQQKQVTDAESVIRETLGSLSTDEWKEIAEGKMDTFQQKVQAHFAKAPAHISASRQELEKRIAFLNDAATQADKERIRLNTIGCPTLAAQQKRDANGYRREAQMLSAQLT